MIEVTPESLIRNGEAIGRLLTDKAVQQVWAALEEVYYKQFKATKTADERELLWAKVATLSDLKLALQAAVDAGQHEAYTQEQAEKARNQH